MGTNRPKLSYDLVMKLRRLIISLLALIGSFVIVAAPTSVQAATGCQSVVQGSDGFGHYYGLAAYCNTFNTGEWVQAKVQCGSLVNGVIVPDSTGLHYSAKVYTPNTLSSPYWCGTTYANEGPYVVLSQSGVRTGTG